MYILLRDILIAGRGLFVVAEATHAKELKVPCPNLCSPFLAENPPKRSRGGGVVPGVFEYLSSHARHERLDNGVGLLRPRECPKPPHSESISAFSFLKYNCRRCIVASI